MALSFITSENDYFTQTHDVLLFNWDIFTDYLKIKGYSTDEIEVYKKAYLYFMDNPLDFDGATMTEDLYDVFRLDLDAMLHDFYYVEYNVSASYIYTRMVDDLFFIETRRKNKSSWNAVARRVLLRLKSWVGFHLYVKHVLKRVMTQEHKELLLKDIETLTK